MQRAVLEHGDFDSARALVEEESSRRKQYHALIFVEDCETCMPSLRRRRVGRDDTLSILARTYYVGSNGEDGQPETGPSPRPSYIETLL